ncbi:MAG: DUF1080 domain-containing protein [Pseudomonadota bacterium]
MAHDTRPLAAQWRTPFRSFASRSRATIGKTAAVLLSAIYASATASAADPSAAQDDWIALFDGEWGDGLEVWISRDGLFPVDDQEIFTLTDDGLIEVYGEDPTYVEDALLMTKQSYENYHFKVEYKWGTAQFNRLDSPKNSGFMYHVFDGPNADDPADTTMTRYGASASYFTPVSGPPQSKAEREEGSFGGFMRGVEFQMRLGQAGGSRLIGTHAIASFDAEGHPAPLGESETLLARGALYGQPYGFTLDLALDSETEWNVAEIIVTGAKARHIINGEEVLVQHDFRVFDPEKRQLAPITSGRVGVQAEGAHLFIRSIKILPM